MTEQQRASDEAAQAEDRTGEPVVTEGTVEALVRTKLAESLGGKRGMVEAAVPTLTFTLSYILSSELRTSILLGVGAALLLGVVRLVQRSSVQYVLTSLFGIGIAAIFAMRSGNAEDAFLPGIIYNAVYAVVLSISVLVRWPAIGLMIGPFIGHREDFTSWRGNPAVVRLASRLTWLLVLPCIIRVLVQYPLWLAATNDWADTFALLGLSKVAMGWPLQVAAFAGMVWVLARGRTPLEREQDTEEPRSGSAEQTGDR
ncbi:hypothetical protein GCM10007079_27130 [Nocardiopsis terrae]|uniref:Intracellular septation protein A n=1 Tax=Nocardiopsis terrae TaxID=372655 RepID=A0ABR9HF85_9ACTN|nr:DUF3159 domain-containing protein [Nocardiopsis terrae]MBE1457683.1 hypothetical protein [Nocardiopsis terrae]GHC84786.1 hypothetical protein GCM10007079_27130 [Nocardiopsis terrae]